MLNDLDRVVEGNEYSKNLEVIINQSIKKVTYDLSHIAYNTAVSTLMILLNKYEECEHITKKDYTLLLTLLNPIAPHLTEELNESLGEKPICENVWPEYDEAKTILNEKGIGVQVNGKLRGTIIVSIDDSEDIIKDKALNNDNVKRHIDGLEIVKVIVIKGRIVNIVVK